MRVCLFLFFVVFATSLFGQARVDSLAATRQVDSLILISRSFAQKGSFGQALDIGLSAEQLAREKIGRMSASYGKISLWLGAVFRISGDMINAEKWDIEGMIIRESLFGKVHIEYAQSLIQYSGTCALMGDLEKSETLLLEAKAILEQLDARESSHYGTLMNSLGNLYADLGNWEKAESCYLQALAIREKILGKEHPNYGATLSNLGLLYLQARRYKEAETYMLEALAMREKSFGKEHPFYAISLNNLGYLYFTLKQYDKAESYYLETLAIREKKLGKENPDYARCLYNIAGVNFRIGRLEKAESLYLEAKAIAEKTIGQQGDLYQKALVEIAEVYEFQNRFDESTQLVIDAFELLQKPLSRSVNFLSEQELFNYMSTFETSNNFLNSILYSRIFRTGNIVQSNGLSSLDFDQALYYKGFLLNNIIRINNLASLNPESAEIMRLLKINRRRLAAEYAKPIAERKNLSELEEKANTFEKELANTSAGYAETMHQIKWPEVQAALKPGEVAIEFVHFQVNSPKPTDSTIYAALLLLPGTKTPQFIPLFEERALESLLKTSGARKSDYVNRLYGNNIPAAQTSLYSLIWEPLAATMVGVKTVYFSPSGLLCRVNLGAVPVREDEILSDRFRFVELGSTRSIAEGTKTSKLTLPSLDAGQVQRNEAQLWGGIQYESDSTAIQNANAGLMNSFSASRGELGFEQTDTASRGGGNWTFLPWTEKEINAIFPILKSAGIQPTLRKGYGATEEMFQAMSTRSPRIVHIATHGYFFPDPKTEQRKEILGSNETCPTFKLSDHPMIRSGLLLAGANQAWKTGKPFKPGMEDGILTAYEISQMDLSNTELVVLSACETGLGDIQGNEGVYGLQRAFKIAGAKYLIMSLWQVPDFQTQELMTVFYTNWLPSAAPSAANAMAGEKAMAGKAEKMSIPDAFRAAQQTMREKYEHPYFWAGFVLVE